MFLHVRVLSVSLDVLFNQKQNFPERWLMQRHNKELLLNVIWVILGPWSDLSNCTQGGEAAELTVLSKSQWEGAWIRVMHLVLVLPPPCVDGCFRLIKGC